MQSYALPLLLLAAPLAAAQVGDGPDAAAPAVAALVVPDDVMLLRMRDGGIHWGAIQEHAPDGLSFQLLEHGGFVQLSWSLLDPLQSEELRTRFGYVDVVSDEYLIEVEKLVLRTGAEVVGVILDREGDNFTVQVDGNKQVIPKRLVESVQSGLQEAALDVYSREDLYSQHAALADATDAAAQAELAGFCERILDFGHAAEHWQAALDLGADSADEETAWSQALERATVKAGQQEQVDYLRQIDFLRKRQKFDEALALLAAFPEAYPDSPLHLDANKKREQVQLAFERALKELVQSRWNYWLRRLSRDAAKKLDYGSAIAYAEETLSQHIQEAVLADVQQHLSAHADLAVVQAAWAARKKGRYDNASFGAGSWLLGNERALAGTEQPGDAGAAQSQETQERQDLQKKIEAFLRNQQQARRARSSEDEAESYDAFWKAFPLNAKDQFIRAYYVEFGGDMELRARPYMRRCSGCGGRGVREVVAIGGGGASSNSGGGGQRSGAPGGGGVQLFTCQACHGVGAFRRVYYR
jgi:hypothetical protein